MSSGTEWLGDRIRQATDMIESGEKPDVAILVPFWRKFQLDHAAPWHMDAVAAEAEADGYALRGNTGIVFVVPEGSADID